MIKDQLRRHASEWVICILLFLITFSVFSRSLSADFVAWDDNLLIYNNPHFKGLNAASLKWMFTDVEYVKRYLPLTWLGWFITYEICGLHPFGYHLGNVLLHALNAALVFLVLRKLLLLREAGCPAEKHKYLLTCSAIGALLWAIHPLRAEPVAWITDRVYSQTLLFLLISFLCYLQMAGLNHDSKRRTKLYWTSVIMFALSLFSYQTGLGYMAVLVIIDVWLLRLFSGEKQKWWGPNVRRVCLEKIPFLCVILVIVWITLMARFNAKGLSEATEAYQTFGVPHRMAQAFYIWTYYLWKPWAPFDLCPVYTTLLSFRPAEPRFLVSFAVIISGTLLFIYKWRQWPLILALWICHLGLLVPVLGLTEHPHFSNDRYCYIASLCWSVLVTAGLLKLWEWEKPRRMAMILSLALVSLLGTMSFQQTGIWQNTVTLLTYVSKSLETILTMQTSIGVSARPTQNWAITLQRWKPASDV